MNNNAIYDTNAEATVISTLIEHPNFILHSDYLKYDCFYDKVNSCIYWAIQQLYQSGVENIDALNLQAVINSKPDVKKRMEEFNLTNLQDYVITSGLACRHTVEEYLIYVDKVLEMAYKRDLNRIAHDIENACYDDKKGINGLSSFVEDRVSKVTERYLVSQDVETFGSRVDELWDEICKRRTADGIYGTPSKFAGFSKYFTYEPGELVLIKARMKRGKSAFFLNEAIHKLQSGMSVLYIDTEMQDRLFFERMLANLTGIHIGKIKSGDLNKQEEMLVNEKKEWIKSQPFIHRYMPNPTNEEIYALHKIAIYKHGVDFSIYDYMKSNATSTGDNYNVLGAKCDFLKNSIAGALNIPMLAGAQLGRQNQVADSDKLERYVSTSIHWREKTKEELAQDGLACGNYAATVELNRNGEQMEEEDYIDFKFDGGKMLITEAEPHNRSRNPFTD